MILEEGNSWKGRFFCVITTLSKRVMAAERAAFLMTECNQEVLSFASHFSRRVEASFTAGQVSTDGGALLLRQADRKIGLLKLTPARNEILADIGEVCQHLTDVSADLDEGCCAYNRGGANRDSFAIDMFRVKVEMRRNVRNHFRRKCLLRV